MNAKPLTPAFVQVTGPYPLRSQRKGRRRHFWNVAVIAAAERKPLSVVYQCQSYRGAVALSCDMARDRKLFLHIEALPV
jgi:hypothetical protein